MSDEPTNQPALTILPKVQYILTPKPAITLDLEPFNKITCLPPAMMTSDLDQEWKYAPEVYAEFQRALFAILRLCTDNVDVPLC
jgi:hypothetical protein